MFESFKPRTAQVVLECGVEEVITQKAEEARQKFLELERKFGAAPNSYVEVETFELQTAFGTRFQTRMTIKEIIPPAILRAITKLATELSECLAVEDDLTAYTIYR